MAFHSASIVPLFRNQPLVNDNVSSGVIFSRDILETQEPHTSKRTIPSMIASLNSPTDAFRTLKITCLTLEMRLCIFWSSATMNTGRIILPVEPVWEVIIRCPLPLNLSKGGSSVS